MVCSVGPSWMKSIAADVSDSPGTRRSCGLFSGYHRCGKTAKVELTAPKGSRIPSLIFQGQNETKEGNQDMEKAVGKRGGNTENLDARFDNFGVAQQPVHWLRQVTGSRFTWRLSNCKLPYEYLVFLLSRARTWDPVLKST